VLRGESCHKEKLYEEAIRLWEEISADTGQARPAPMDRVHYSLGECYQQLNRPTDAIAAWEKAAQDGGEGGQAATFRLAESKLAKQDGICALVDIEKVLAGQKSSGDYYTSLLDLT